MSARRKFLDAVTALIGQPVVWGGLDCSEAVALGMLAATDGKTDQRKTHRAQTYFDETRPLWPLERAIPGDFGFYGTLPDDSTKEGATVIHIVVVLEDGKVLSADGATSKVVDPAVAALNPLSKVAVHETLKFRRDFLGVHRNTLVDALDFVAR